MTRIRVPGPGKTVAAVCSCFSPVKPIELSQRKRVTYAAVLRDGPATAPKPDWHRPLAASPDLPVPQKRYTRWYETVETGADAHALRASERVCGAPAAAPADGEAVYHRGDMQAYPLLRVPRQWVARKLLNAAATWIAPQACSAQPEPIRKNAAMDACEVHAPADGGAQDPLSYARRDCRPWRCTPHHLTCRPQRCESRDGRPWRCTRRQWHALRGVLDLRLSTG